MTTEQNWPAGWTPQERIETVVNEQVTTGNSVAVEMIADTADVDAETARGVVREIANRGTIHIVERGDTELVSRQPDYSDTRWGEVDNA